MGSRYHKLHVSTIMFFKRNPSNASPKKFTRYAYAGCDAPIHIAEEVPKPGVKIPAVMNLTMLIGALTVFPLMTLMSKLMILFFSPSFSLP